MRIRYKIFTLGLLAASFTLTSCDDFLDRKPLSSVTPEEFFQNDKHLAAYAINNYGAFTVKGGYNIGPVTSKDNDTDNMGNTDSSLDRWLPYRQYTGVASVFGESKDKAFFNIRNANFFLTSVLPKHERGEIQGETKDIEHYIGEMYFFRGWYYFQALSTYGDFPITEETFPDDKEILTTATKRMPRNEVARFILKDLDKAIEMMQPKGVSPAIDGNRLSSEVALLIKSRVALFEASWLKYHAGTARVPGGQGWPGEKLHPNYQFPAGSLDAEVDFFLTVAMDASKKVADAIPLQGQGKGLLNPAGTEATGWNDYYEMFGAESMAKYSEVLLWRAYDAVYEVHSVANYIRRGGNTGFTKGYMESFVMNDGKPIYAAGNDYKGDVTIDDMKVNRDTRLQLFVVSESDRFDIRDTESTFGRDDDKNKDAKFPFMLNEKETRMTTGYSPRKTYNYDARFNVPNAQTETSASLVFRATEAYLNYMEASYMKTGSLDGTAKKYWGQIRQRAGMPEDSYNVTIANTNMAMEAKGDWAAYSSGKLLTDPILYNIRRERRCEFIAEGMRWDDLKRWAALNQVRNYIVEGFNLWDKMHERYFDINNEGEKVNLLVEAGPSNANVSAKSDGKYLRLYRIQKSNNELYDGYNWRQAKYLSPLGVKDLQLASPTGSVDDSNMYQNPYWPTKGGESSMKSSDPLDN